MLRRHSPRLHAYLRARLASLQSPRFSCQCTPRCAPFPDSIAHVCRNSPARLPLRSGAAPVAALSLLPGYCTPRRTRSSISDSVPYFHTRWEIAPLHPCSRAINWHVTTLELLVAIRRACLLRAQNPARECSDVLHHDCYSNV